MSDLEKKMAHWQGSSFAKLFNRKAQESQPEKKVEEKKAVDESKKSTSSIGSNEKKPEKKSSTCDLL